METTEQLASFLRQVPFMRTLPAVYRQELAKICYSKHYGEGEEIFAQGFITDRFFVVADGQVHFRRTDANQVWHSAGDARPGQHFGLAMFTTQALSEYKAEALIETTAYVMERSAFDRLIEAQPDILRAMRPIYQRRSELTRGFDWLTPGEEVVLTTHRHWYALIESLVVPVALALVLCAIVAIVLFFGLEASLSFPLLLAAVPALLIAVWLAYAANDYVNDDFIVTNKRVAQFERTLLKKEMRYQIPNNKIQSMTVRKTGPIASALGISDLEVRSAGRADSRIVFDRVARAESIRQTILKQQGNLRSHDEAEMRRRFRDRVQNDLIPYISKESEEHVIQEAPEALPHTSWTRLLLSAWGRMFGRELRDGTTITYRKHWVVLARQVGRWIFFLIVLLLALILYLSVPVLQILPSAPTLAVFAFLFLVDLAGLAWQWEDWRNDIYQVTDSQIIDIERLPFGLWSRSTEALLSNVQDARALRPRPINSILDYGNVEVQTASGGPPLIFYDVPSPEAIVEELFRRMEEHRLRVMEHQSVVLGQQVTDALITYDRMKEKKAAFQEGSVAATATEIEGGAQPDLPRGAETASLLGDGEASKPVAGSPISTGTRVRILREFSSQEEADD